MAEEKDAADILVADFKRQAHVLFCDDVRKEASGKWLFIGAYENQLYTQEIPVNLPSLVAVIYIKTPADKPFSTLSIAATLAGETIASIEMPLDGLKAAQDQLEAEKQGVHDWVEANDPGDIPPLRIHVVCIQLVMSPFTIKAEGVLRILITGDGERIRAGHLQIRRASQKEEEAGLAATAEKTA